MIAPALDIGRGKGSFRPQHVEPVGLLVAGDSEGAKYAGHRGNAVALLVAQLFGVANAGRAQSSGCQRACDRDLVDGAGHSLAPNGNCPQRSAPTVQLGDWLTTAFALGFDRKPCPPIARDLEQPSAGGVDAHAANGTA